MEDRNTQLRFKKCDECGKATPPPAAGVYDRNNERWVCLSCPIKLSTGK